jgi:hypothetical protein
MFTEHIHVSAAPDFVIKVGQVIHSHTIAISFKHKQSKYKDELFSHRSQIEVVKHLQERILAEGLGGNAIIEWSYAENLSAEIANTGLEVDFEYRLPTQLHEETKASIMQISLD